MLGRPPPVSPHAAPDKHAFLTGRRSEASTGAVFVGGRTRGEPACTRCGAIAFRREKPRMAIEFRENEVFEVGPGVWIRNMVDNAAWADLGSGAVVIDALDPADDGPMEQQIPEDVRRTTGKPMKWLVNTHWHPDHIGFNA